MMEPHSLNGKFDARIKLNKIQQEQDQAKKSEEDSHPEHRTHDPSITFAYAPILFGRTLPQHSMEYQ
jgi:hypothetical protein